MNAIDETNSVTVGLDDRSYKILIGRNTLSQIGEVCLSHSIGKRLAVISNTTVGALYLKPVSDSLEAAGFSVHTVEIPDGEEFKSLYTLASIYDRLVAAGLDRSSSIVALGGGVVGDVAGFAAATFLRGIPFIQVPTTLLAQVDSSVGGKTGVNLTHGKNLVGAFYQPALVLIDVMTLATLSEREYIGGLAEIVKYGIVLDKGLFQLLEENVDSILKREPDLLINIVARCCSIKASVVSKDERESGLRAVLNYGHTLGHAVETVTKYNQYTHGEAVAIGMIAAARYSEMCGLSGQEETKRIRSLIERLGLPVIPPNYPVAEYSALLLRDKKVRDGGIKFVCNRGIGDFSFVHVEDLKSLLAASCIGE